VKVPKNKVRGLKMMEEKKRKEKIYRQALRLFAIKGFDKNSASLLAKKFKLKEEEFCSLVERDKNFIPSIFGWIYRELPF